MSITSNYYQKHEQLWVTIKKTLPNLITLKREENRIAFNNSLLEITPEIKKYLVSRMRMAIKKNHFPKNKYTPDDFIDQLFIETYDHIQEFTNESEFYIWLYKKINELLDDAITEETFDDLFFTNIDVFSKLEWEQLEEKFTAESDGDLIMKEDLDDISYYKDPYTLKDVFIENTETELVNKIDDTLQKEKIDRHIQVVLHNLSSPMQRVFELYTKQQFTLEEIAAIQDESVEKINQLMSDARKALKVSLFNRYTVD
jgi:RNA polymerase sigma factor (sigma-70 family)